MVGFRLLSDRLKDAAKAGTPDVYQYDTVSPKARVQIRQVVGEVFGEPSRISGNYKAEENSAAAFVVKTVSRERGSDYLGYAVADPYKDVLLCLEKCPNETFFDVLDVIATAFQAITQMSNYKQLWCPRLSPEEGVEEINFRLRDDGVGYQIEGGSLHRIDSEFIHSEAVKPALKLLAKSGYEGPQSEFLTAHHHYRAGRNKEAIVEAAKAFESMMKAVCDKNGWAYQKGARATDLIKVLKANRLWPDYLDNSFDQLLATLGSGLPKIRNEEAAHGQGASSKAVPEYIAAYALHLAASKIVFIGEAAATKAQGAA